MTESLVAARAAVEAVEALLQTASNELAQRGLDGDRLSVAKLDEHQVLAYDLAHACSAIAASRVMLDYATHGEYEARLSFAFIADAIADVVARIVGREHVWGVDLAVIAGAHEFVNEFRDPTFLASLGDEVAKLGTGPSHLDEEFDLVRDTFLRFAEDKIRPVAEHIHRTNDDIPESIIAGMAEIGGFGLSVPEEYGGFAAGGESDFLAMCVATESLSWGSLGAGGALITRPEILTRAIVRGGTEEQKHRFLPAIASGERVVGVMVTEPDFGSDVAGVKTTATAVDGGYVINGVKTWCTFAGRADTLMVLVRTNPDRSLGHKGLSVVVAEKPVAAGHHFAFEDDRGGKLEGRAIDTIGYRGMHSYEVSFDNWFVPADNLIGLEEGMGRGFYLQMEGFENGRLQTAARAVGLMQAAFEAGLTYANDRNVFGQSVFSYQLSKVKIARMAALICAGRQFSYAVAKMMARGEGALEASMVKAYVCRTAEWVTREAMQLHGGMGYAEEFPVSRYFVDARVLSIFEGADETLCLRVIARRLAERALAG
ncbi:MAG: acyl-CoA dehydrogenase family protein [Acidimicrobiia bacterium]